MMKYLASILVGLMVLGGMSGNPATAQQPPGQVSPGPVEIEGFRSARFGLKESELRSVIAKDLGIDAKAIRKEAHAVERTESLVVSVTDLLPDTGPATVAYILGARSKTLMQVNILWSAANDDREAVERLTATANILRNYFLSKGEYAKDSVLANALLPDRSVLVFRGADRSGRMVAVHLVPPPPSGEGEKRPAGSATLRLSYIEKPNAPDIFKLDPGAF